MKKWIAPVFIFGMMSLSCGQKKDKPAAVKDPATVLSNPPFAGLTDSIRQFPEDPKLYLSRALLLSQHNLHELATPDYLKTWQLTADPQVALEYASNLLLINQVDSAESLLERVGARFPDDNDVKRRLGEIYAQTGRQQKAMEQYNAILGTDPSNFEAWYDKGELAMKLGDTSTAIEALEKSFSAMPISYSGLVLAQLYTARKDPKALRVCDILIAQDTAGVQTEPIFQKGVFYSETKQYAKALEQFDLCIKRDWKTTDAYIEKGIIYMEQKNYAEALKILQLATTVSNTDADAYYWIGRCYEAQHLNQQAIENYQRALSLDPQFYEAAVRLKQLEAQ